MIPTARSFVLDNLNPNDAEEHERITQVLIKFANIHREHFANKIAERCNEDNYWPIDGYIETVKKENPIS